MHMHFWLSFIITFCHYKCQMISTKGKKKLVFLVPIYADSFTRFAKIIALTPASAVHTTCLVSWFCVAVCSLSFILMSWPTVSRFVCFNIKKNKYNSKYIISNQAFNFLRLNPNTEKKDNSKTTFYTWILHVFLKL